MSVVVENSIRFTGLFTQVDALAPVMREECVPWPTIPILPSGGAVLRRR